MPSPFLSGKHAHVPKVCKRPRVLETQQLGGVLLDYQITFATEATLVTFVTQLDGALGDQLFGVWQRSKTARAHNVHCRRAPRYAADRQGPQQCLILLTGATNISLPHVEQVRAINFTVANRVRRKQFRQ